MSVWLLYGSQVCLLRRYVISRVLGFQESKDRLGMGTGNNGIDLLSVYQVAIGEANVDLGECSVDFDNTCVCGCDATSRGVRGSVWMMTVSIL